MIGAVTAGWWSSHASATSAGRSPSSLQSCSHRSEPVAVRLDLLAHVVGGAPALAQLLERAGEQPAGERAVADQPHPVLADRGDHLELDRPLVQVVDGLLGREAERVAPAASSFARAMCHPAKFDEPT